MKADLKKRIRTAKREAWKQICDKINEDVWGDGTVSTAAAQVIAGVPPIHLLVEERAALYEARPGYGNGKEARDRTIERWQEEWDAHGSTAQWTKMLIPDIKSWLDCPHRTTDYYFTQALTGHGSVENRIRPELLLDQEFVVDYSYLFLALPGTSLSPARVEKPR
ncbi:hypothetical protein NQ315_012922 [Exocentrus adspersus]|uniref:Transposase n=1 Tax=Exocentrus adspersus TaxID=1586481 RepID=A0AAV8VSD7_9CUCU|nr:hypothetical protein NQ315_012922 [Exocentrus adspersus]